MSTSYPALGLTIRFHVRVDGLDLGAWKSCKGLNVSFKSKPQFEGGNYKTPVAILPEQLEYGTITLQRAMSRADSEAVQNWLAVAAEKWMQEDGASYPGGDAVITLFDSAYSEEYIARWTLHNVYPSKWAGPELDAMGNAAIATETLELVHYGFLKEPS